MPRETQATDAANGDSNRFPHHHTLAPAEPLTPHRGAILPAGPSRYFLHLQPIAPAAAHAEEMFAESSLLPPMPKLSAAAS